MYIRIDSGEAWPRCRCKVSSRMPLSHILVACVCLLCRARHNKRHTFASWYMMNGGDLYELAKILGHSNIMMMERYAKLAWQHIARTSSTAREMWKLLEPICDKANVG